MSEELIKAIILASTFIIPGCLICILLFIYYSREQKVRLFQAQVEAEAKYVQTQEKLMDLVDALGSQYNAKLNEFMRWMVYHHDNDDVLPESLSMWKPDIKNNWYY